MKQLLKISILQTALILCASICSAQMHVMDRYVPALTNEDLVAEPLTLEEELAQKKRMREMLPDNWVKPQAKKISGRSAKTADKSASGNSNVKKNKGVKDTDNKDKIPASKRYPSKVSGAVKFTGGKMGGAMGVGREQEKQVKEHKERLDINESVANATKDFNQKEEQEKLKKAQAQKNDNSNSNGDDDDEFIKPDNPPENDQENALKALFGGDDDDGGE